MTLKNRIYILGTILLSVFIHSACNNTRHLKEGQYLLKSNSVEFEDTKYLESKGELSDRLQSAIVQKPNSSFIIDGLKTKLFFYNLRYDKYQNDTTDKVKENKSVEAPVLYDSSTITQSKTYMESYLFHQGYFYAKVTDTTIFNERKKKAKVIYRVDPGFNYLIRRVYFSDISDPVIKQLVQTDFNTTQLRAGKPYSASLVEQERTRITRLLKDKGYYYFTNESISFELDTVNKDYEKIKESLITEAADLVTLKKEQARPTLDIYIKINNSEDGKAFTRCGINRILVFPDFVSREDASDSTMVVKKIDNTTFRYHDYYVRERVLHNHIFINPNGYYAQSDYDKTINELNQLGVFETVRTVYFEDTSRTGEGLQWLSAAILMSPAKKYDFNTSWDASTGTTYTLGSGLSASLSNKNIAKGANLLTFTGNVGVETQYDSSDNNLKILTRTAGLNASLEFPKFLLPISRERYSIRNTPRTEVAVGANWLDRVNFFTLINLTSRFTYKWRETSTKNWEVSPIFINDISLNNISQSFQDRLDTNDFLRNSYKETFIEGENITWTFSNANKAHFYDDYSYVKLSFEEAGGLVSGIDRLLPDSTIGNFSQYVRLDYDLRHFIKQRHATTALRLYGGVGIPYGQSPTLPYLKQYFVGGPFSMRGWNIRTLGPGSFTDTSKNADQSATNLIDLTGDIKIELNAEYRFDIFKLFGGVFQFNGVVFGDAGNIWLSKQSASYPNGEFRFDRFYTDLAVDGGVGIRADIAGLFVLRLDWAVPLKVPGTLNIPEKNIKQGWIVDDIDPLYNKWRQSIIWNFAIGYPF